MAQIHWRLPAGDARRSSPAAARGSWRRAQRYVLFAFSSGVATWSDYIMFIGFPLVFARTASLPVWLVPIVIFSNTAIVILCQVQVARWVDARRDPRPLLSAGFLVFSACVAAMATFYLGVNKWVLVACLLLITVFVTGVELVVESVRWKIRYDLAPDHAQGLYSGYFNLGDSVAKAVGPIVIGSALGVWREFGWIGLAVTVFCAGVVARASAVQRSPVAEKPPAAEVSGVRADTWEATT